jgi:hypothetical protein
VDVKYEKNFLAHALVISKARLDKAPEYNSYRRGYKIWPDVENLLQTTGIDLQNGGAIPELEKFQEYFKEYSINVYGVLHCEDIIYDGMVCSERRLNLLYDDVTRHYHVITSLTGAMARTIYVGIW